VRCGPRCLVTSGRFSDLRIEAERIIDLGGDRVLVLSRQTARGKPSGVPIDHEFGAAFG